VWDRIQRLHEHHGDVPLEVRILKLTEEVGEVAEASGGSSRPHIAWSKVFGHRSDLSDWALGAHFASSHSRSD
jgi:NTP pyrophosphatase (non-canonical NTP hydrolase)